MLFALKELIWTLWAAFEAADLKRRLRAWRYVVTHRELIEDRAPNGEQVTLLYCKDSDEPLLVVEGRDGLAD
jgi:hypothetical protein